MKKSNNKSLKQACWRAGTNVAELCRVLGISRQTAYTAWKNPQLVPLASKRMVSHLEENEKLATH